MATSGGPPSLKQTEPTPEQWAQLAAANKMTVPQLKEIIMKQQKAMEAEAQARGMTIDQLRYIKKKEVEAKLAAAHAAQAQGQGQPGAPQAQQPGQPPAQAPQQPAKPAQQMQKIEPGPPNPAALAVANFLKKQNLKPRTCLLNDQRKEMFKVKRALRALQSPEYEKARAKNPLLPKITDRASLENTFKLLPLSMLALRVSKIDEHAGHNHAPPKKDKKRVKGLWNVKIEPQQECKEELHFVWLYEGSQVMQKVYAALAIVAVFAIVMFPLWPMKMRQGVWYLSMGMLGLIGLFFAMSIFRLILFAVTMFAVPPGLWLYPNLFEDVGFFDSFRPVWGWQEVS